MGYDPKMQTVMNPHVKPLVDELCTQMQAILGEKLVGLYLYGSLVMGDFDEDISDIDLLAAMTCDLDEAAFAALDTMHKTLVTTYKWEDRLEIAYLSVEGLKTFRSKSSPIGIIHPGEPFHMVEAGHDWMINWYVVRNNGQTLVGSPPEAVIAPITTEEFIETVKVHARWWQTRIDDMEQRKEQAYAILTLCRALYTVKNAEQVSKIQAASWVANEYPDWAPTIQNAVKWRKAWREPVENASATLPEVRQFVEFATGQILT